MKFRIAASLICLFIPLAAFAYTSPGKPTGYVNDFAHVISAPVHQSLESQLQTVQNSTGIQIVVVTIPSLGNDETIETYAVKLFQEWGIGNKDKDNGLLILVAPADHQARIEVGYGLEGVVTDVQSNNIVRNVMIPSFKTNDYDTGISGAVDAITGIISGSDDTSMYSTAQPSGSGSFNWQGILFVVFILLSILTRILSRTKSWWLGGVIGAVIGIVIGLVWGFFFTGIISIIILTILGLVFDYIVSKHPPMNGPGGPFMFFGGGRGLGGGGFGGFGGGSSGGGGASGKW